jgi:hypothetical protein
MLEGTEDELYHLAKLMEPKPLDEQYERIYDPESEGNLARAIVKKSVFVLLVIPKNITTGEYDPTWAHLLQHDDGSNRTVVFYNCEDAFQFAMKYIEDPWQVVEL